MADYTQWKIKKTVINYKGDDEKKITAAQESQQKYQEVAEWCKKNNGYTISEDSQYYKVVPIAKPDPLTKDELAKLREKAYAATVDGITAHIQRLRDEEAMTPELEEEIRILIQERKEKIEKIKELYPYPEEE